MHQIEDMKLSIHSLIDVIFKDFLIYYRDLKAQVSQLRANRRMIL